MSKLDELGIGEEEKIEMPDDVPEEKERRVELAQPSTYVFRLPENMDNIWGVFDSKKGKRIYASFNKENALTIYQDDKFEHYHEGRPVNLLINNLEYPRGAERIEVADMTYLIKALESTTGSKTKLTTNKAFADALSKFGGALFEAELSWNAYCNPNKDIYVQERDENDVATKATQQDGQTGCSKSYNSYARNKLERIPEDENNWFIERFEETTVHGDEYVCPAILFANARLGRFKAVTE